MTAPGDGPGEPVPWRRAFIALAEKHDWTPRQIAQMTLGQVVSCLRDAGDEGPMVRISRGEAEALVRERQRQRNRWIDEELARSD
jgi:hypothetical protein